MKIDTFDNLKLETYKDGEKYIARIIDKHLGFTYRYGKGDTPGDALVELYKKLKFHLFEAKRHVAFFEEEMELVRIQEFMEDQNE